MSLIGDLRYAVRTLLRTPAFTIPAVVSLALGIALNTTIFTMVSAVLLRPVGDPDLVRIGRTTRGETGFRSSTYREFLYLREHASSLQDIAGAQMESVALAGPAGSEAVSADFVTGNYFSVLRMTPTLGRNFTEDEDRGAVAMLSDRLWRTRFGADPAVLGKVVRLNNVPFTVVGVASPLEETEIDVWMPLFNQEITRTPGNRGFPPSMGLVGHLKAGSTLANLRAELDVLARQLAEEDPGRDPNRAFSVASARGMHPGIAGPLSIFLALLMGVVGVVLLTACANVASLLLARATARHSEVAVRLALGASRGRLIGQLLVESAALATLGGAAGLAAAIWPVRLLNTLLAAARRTGFPFAINLELDSRVLIFTAAVILLTTFGFGLVPALQATRVDLLTALKDSRASGSRGRSRLRGALMVAQVAIAFVLLVAGTLLFQSLRNSTRLDLGFASTQTVVASFGSLALFGHERPRVESFYEELLSRVRDLPGVEGAALAGFVPLVRGTRGISLVVPEQTEAAGGVGEVSPEYFSTLRIPLLRGREFTAADQRAVVINEAVARQFWPGQDPVGKRIGLRQEDLQEYEIIGVAADARLVSLAGEVPPLVFLRGPAGGTLHVRATGPPVELLAEIKRIGQEIEPNLPPFSGQTLGEAMADSLLPARVSQIVFGVASLIALLLASGGLYGLVAYTLEHRLKEIGIRVAMGATRVGVFRTIIGGAAKLTALGIVIGAGLALAVTRLLTSFLFGVSPTDPVIFGGIALVLAAVTVGAGYAAARKGLNVDPMVALRHE